MLDAVEQLHVRPATVKDVPAVAALHVDAFRGTIGAALGARYARAFVGWFVDEPQAACFVVTRQERVVGYVVGALDGYGPRLTRDLLPVIARCVVTRPFAVVTHPSFRRQVRSRLAHLAMKRESRSHIATQTPAGCFCLVAIATGDAARGLGGGAQLVAALDAFAARAGAERVILDVYRDNAPALSLYRRTGFVELAWQDDVVRMSRPVGGGTS